MSDSLIYPQKSDGKPVPKSLTISGYFNVKFDSTDHFWIECAKCKVDNRNRRDKIKVNEKKVEVTRVFREDRYNNTNDEPRIYFYLKCPECKATGQRKIYLKCDKNWKK
ncbi:hypothetical protein ES705_21337 [subsurface metagenome]